MNYFTGSIMILKHLFSFLINFLICVHVSLNPCLKLLFAQLSIMVCIDNLYSISNFLFLDFSDISSSWLCKHVLVHLHHHTDEVVSFFFIKRTTFVIIVLVPNLVNDVLDNFFWIALILIFLKKLSCINPHFIFLPDKDREKNLRNIVWTNISNLLLRSSFSFSHVFCFCILIEFIEWSTVIIFWASLVK